MGKQGLKITMHDTPVTGVNIKPPKVKNPTNLYLLLVK